MANGISAEEKAALLEDRYPEHRKVEDNLRASRTIGGFLEWLGEERFELATYEDGALQAWLPGLGERGIKELLARFFDIDLKAFEAEKLQMLKELRERS